jgi:hypothetical protein
VADNGSRTHVTTKKEESDRQAKGSSRTYPDESKHPGVEEGGELNHQVNFHVVCLNKTKLTIPVYLDNYWSCQIMLQSNGNRWKAAINKVNMTLFKSVGTYLTNVRQEVQILNCYLEPGEQQFQVERAKRKTDIIINIIKHDVEIVIERFAKG